MENFTASSTERATSFISQFDLSSAALSSVSDAIRDGQAWASIGLLVLWLLFPNISFRAGAPGYKELEDVNWSLCARLPAGLIFTPESAKDVAKAMPVVSFFEIPFAIRSGGHTPHAGPGSSDGGLLIALDKMKQKYLSPDGKIAHIGTGNQWIEVYDYLQPQGKLVVGGRLPPIGVGGLTTGGGISYFSNRYGFACDMVESFQVVLASGKIVTASANKHPDLFKALKGGSGNFGIVTRFDLRTVPTHGVWGGSVSFTPDKYPSLIKALVNYQTKHQAEDPDAAMIQNIFFAGAGKLQGWLSMLFHASPSPDYPPSLAPWKAVGSVSDSTRATTFTNLTRDYSDAVRAPMRQDFRTVTIGVSEDLYTETINLFRETYQGIASVPGLQAMLTFQPMGIRTFKEGYKNGGNILGVDPVPQTWLCLTLTWVNAADDDIILSTGKKFFDAVAALARQRGLSHNYLYLNDAGKDQQVIASYGAKNVAFMKEVAKKFDRKGVFQKQRTAADGFKLG